jgi:hypothetical protein
VSEKRSYRAYLLSGSDNIRAVIVLEAGDDASACLEAGIRLRESDCAAIEVWEERRLVWHTDREQPAGETSQNPEQAAAKLAG